MTLPSTIRTRELNDPEYRWYHKEEMSKIMPFVSERKRLGLKVIDYPKLRREFLSTIKEVRYHDLDWVLFKKLIDAVPTSVYNETTKKTLQPMDMYHFEKRDRCECYLCGTISRRTQLHHIIPTGDTSDKNIVTLCGACHKMVHIALYSSGKRKGWM
ncbi:MAG: hypothetical protein WC998_06670 [Candidatus Paceibacterota bacterium]|jgi:hypothetical protein